MIKVDFHQLWSEFKDWLRHIMIWEHETNKNKQHLNTYGEYGIANPHSEQISGLRMDFWLLYGYAIDLMDCQSSKNLV